MKKVLLNNRQMGLLSKAFLDNLFPRPYQGELKSGLVITYVNQKECLSWILILMKMLFFVVFEMFVVKKTQESD